MKNKREILQALLDGETIYSRVDEVFVNLDENGETFTRFASGDFEKGCNWLFGTPESWEIFKEKKKITIKCYGVIGPSGNIVDLMTKPIPMNRSFITGSRMVEFFSEVEVDA